MKCPGTFGHETGDDVMKKVSAKQGHWSSSCCFCLYVLRAWASQGKRKLPWACFGRVNVQTSMGWTTSPPAPPLSLFWEGRLDKKEDRGMIQLSSSWASWLICNLICEPVAFGFTQQLFIFHYCPFVIVNVLMAFGPVLLKVMVSSSFLDVLLIKSTKTR